MNRSQFRQVKEIFGQSKDYLQLEGKEVDIKESARNFFDTLPPGKSYAEKFNFGIYEGSQLVGLLDFIQGYPERETDFVGLLLLLPSARQKGVGSQVQKKIVKLAKNHGAKKIRLAVLRNNPQAIKFWISKGYKLKKETRSLGIRANPVSLLELEI